MTLNYEENLTCISQGNSHRNNNSSQSTSILLKFLLYYFKSITVNVMEAYRECSIVQENIFPGVHWRSQYTIVSFKIFSFLRRFDRLKYESLPFGYFFFSFFRQLRRALHFVCHCCYFCFAVLFGSKVKAMGNWKKITDLLNYSHATILCCVHYFFYWSLIEQIFFSLSFAYYDLFFWLSVNEHVHFIVNVIL